MLDKRFFALMIALVWLVGTVVALWYFFYMPLRPFAKHDALEGINSVRLLSAQTSTMTVVHFVDDDCPCTKFGLDHIAGLVQTYDELEHYKINPQTGLKDFVGKPISQVLVTTVEGVPLEFSRDIREWVLSSPSVAVFGAGGEIRYYGPYTAGAVCGEGFDFVAPVLESAEDTIDSMSEVKDWSNLSSFGCFCDW